MKKIIYYVMICSICCFAQSLSNDSYKFLSSYTDLENAVKSIGVQEVTLVISTVTIVNTSFTIPHNITLQFYNGGVIKVLKENSLDLECTFNAPLNKIFDGDGIIKFGPGIIEKMYPEWFGAAGNGITDDAEAINKAIQAASFDNANVPVQFLSKKYYLSSSIKFSHKAQLLGSGPKHTYIVSAAEHVFEADSLRPITNVLIDGFNIRGKKDISNQDGIYISTSINQFKTGGMWFSTLKNLDIANLTGRAINFNVDTSNIRSKNVYSYIHQFNVIEKCQLDYNQFGGIRVFGLADQFYFNQVEITNSYLSVSDVDLYDCNTFQFNVCTFQGSLATGVKLYGCQNITISTCWFEGLDNGIQMLGTNNDKEIGIDIMNNTFRNVKYTSVYGENVEAVRIELNRFWIASKLIEPTTQVNVDLNNKNSDTIIEANTYNSLSNGKGIINTIQ